VAFLFVYLSIWPRNDKLSGSPMAIDRSSLQMLWVERNNQEEQSVAKARKLMDTSERAEPRPSGEGRHAVSWHLVAGFQLSLE
jgi:hypothetical protein